MFPLIFKRILGVISVLVTLAVMTYLIKPKKSPPPSPVITKTEILTPTKSSRRILGKSKEGRNIEVYTYGNGGTHITFVGGMHGGYEWNSVLLAYTFIDYLSEHLENIPENLTIEIIPAINPDGVYKVTGKDGRFTKEDVSVNQKTLASGRFNANNVDLNRNFDCKWKTKSTWRSKIVSAGTEAFSEPEAKILRDFVTQLHPSLVVFWHSQSNGVYASQCENGILPETLKAMSTYAEASGYPAIKTFDAYETTGAADDWLASVKIPAITVELKTHTEIEWDKNLSGIQAIIKQYSR
jgi:predicted deacylase